MEELIPIKLVNNRHLVSARDLHKGLGLTTRFSKWVSQDFKGLKKNTDFMSVTTVTDMPNGGTKPIQDYLLTIDSAKKIAMMAKTDKGNQVRDYFIEVERKYKEQISLKQPDSYMIKDPIKRAERWIQEKKDYLKQKQLADKEAKQLKDQENDVIFSKTMLATNHACKIRELAADLTKMGFIIGQNQLYELLRKEKYISKFSTMPMGDKVKRGYLIVRHGVKNGHAWSQTMVTPKGQKHIIGKCLRGKWDKAYQKVMAGTLSI